MSPSPRAAGPAGTTSSRARATVNTFRPRGRERGAKHRTGRFPLDSPLPSQGVVCPDVRRFAGGILWEEVPLSATTPATVGQSQRGCAAGVVDTADWAHGEAPAGVLRQCVWPHDSPYGLVWVGMGRNPTPCDGPLPSVSESGAKARPGRRQGLQVLLREGQLVGRGWCTVGVCGRN